MSKSFELPRIAASIASFLLRSATVTKRVGGSDETLVVLSVVLVVGTVTAFVVLLVVVATK